MFFHELGHFLVARWCGVAVKAFSIGFGPEIAGFTDRHGTRWKLSWIPLGGYVKFIDDENAAAQAPATLEGMAEEERKRQLSRLSRSGARAAVVAAGPIANFLLAIVVFTHAFHRFSAEPHVRPKVDSRRPGQRRRAGRHPPGRSNAQHRRAQPIDSFARHAAHRERQPGADARFRRRTKRREVESRRRPELEGAAEQHLGARFGSGCSAFSGRTPGGWTMNGTIRSTALSLAVQRDATRIVKTSIIYLVTARAGRECRRPAWRAHPNRASIRGRSLGSVLPLLNLAAIISVSIGLINLSRFPCSMVVICCSTESRRSAASL